MAASEIVPTRSSIEFTVTGLERAKERLGLSEADAKFYALRAKRVDLYKDGLRLWRVPGGWLAVHEVQLGGSERLHAVVVTALADDMTAGWLPRQRAA